MGSGDQSDIHVLYIAFANNVVVSIKVLLVIQNKIAGRVIPTVSLLATTTHDLQQQQMGKTISQLPNIEAMRGTRVIPHSFM